MMPPSPQPEILLRGTERIRIRRLRGFVKTAHREPDAHNPATESFVRKVGTDDVSERAEILYRQIREAYGWKRRQLAYRLDPGLAVIETPGFAATVAVEQDVEDPRFALLSISVGGHASVGGEGEIDERLVAVFGRSCDTVVIALPDALDLEERIDFAEDHPRLAEHLEYPADASWMRLRLEHPPITMQLEATEVRFQIPRGGDLRGLLEGSSALLGLFAAGGSGLVPRRA